MAEQANVTERADVTEQAEQREESPAKRLLALVPRLHDLLDVVNAEIALRKDEKEILRELSELRAELMGQRRPARRPVDEELPPEPGPDGSRILSDADIERIRTRIDELETRARSLDPKDPRLPARQKQIERLQLRRLGDVLDRMAPQLPDHDDEGE